MVGVHPKGSQMDTCNQFSELLGFQPVKGEKILELGTLAGTHLFTPLPHEIDHHLHVIP